MIWVPLSEVPQIGCIPSLHPHTSLIHPTADPDHAGYQLWHADSILLPGGVILATGSAIVSDLNSPKKRAYRMMV